MKKLMIVTAIVWIMISIVAAEEVANIRYVSDVDQDYGFYRVIDYTTHKPAPYTNYTLTINAGDIVEWVNDATPDEPLTIISKEGLWDNRSAYLRWNYQRFSYTFNESGTYEVYIKEYPRERHQIIIVNATETPTITPVSTPIVTRTEYPQTPIETTPAVSKDVTSNGTEVPTCYWLLVVAVGLLIFVIYEYRKRKK